MFVGGGYSVLKKVSIASSMEAKRGEVMSGGSALNLGVAS
jgi:hypothetical protein